MVGIEMKDFAEPVKLPYPLAEGIDPFSVAVYGRDEADTWRRRARVGRYIQEQQAANQAARDAAKGKTTDG